MFVKIHVKNSNYIFHIVNTKFNADILVSIPFQIHVLKYFGIFYKIENICPPFVCLNKVSSWSRSN